jgi:peptidyl-dipeptidase A
VSEAPHLVVAALEARLSELESEFHRAYWDSQVLSNAANDRRRAELELELRRAKGDERALDDIVRALAEPIEDRTVRRSLEVLRLSLAGNQMSDEQRERSVELASAIESEFTSHRGRVDGRELSDNDIEDVLRASDDSLERERAWVASKDIGGVVAEHIRELARVRNSVARDAGFDDYYAFALHLQEIDAQWLFELLGELERLTGSAFERWKSGLDERLSRRFSTTELRPWHYADPFFQTLPPDGRVTLDDALDGRSIVDLTTKTFDGWGIDLEPVMRRSDLYPRADKCQHAFCLDVDRTGADVRILANVVPGERWMDVMLHESGHAAYDVAISRELPYALHRPAHTFVTEAMAILSGKLVKDPEWMTRVAGIAQSDAAGLQRATAAQTLLFARWGLVMVHFERALYDDPEGDLDARWWDLVERFQGVARPPGRRRPDWAAKIHVAVAPVYYHNYLLGELLAARLRAECERRFGGLVGSADAGAYLRADVFAPGASMRWDALVTSASGSPLSAQDFAGATDV